MNVTNFGIVGCVVLLVLAFHFSLDILKNNFTSDRSSYLDYDDSDDSSNDLLTTLNWDDPKLIQVIQNWFIEYPDPSAPYHFLSKDPKLEGQFGQATFVDELLGHKTNGFFIECGAFNGETFSSTLLFELTRNWTGLLIEPNRNSSTSLQMKNRKTFNINACLSGGKHPETKRLINAGPLSGVSDAQVPEDFEKSRNNQFPRKYMTKTPCFPLYSILLAVGNPEVDFLSLNVEGFEWEIIKSIPWDKVDITVVDLDYSHLGDKKNLLEQFMSDNGYKVAKQIADSDLIFIKESFYGT